MTDYFRPLVNYLRPAPKGALPLAGGQGWFTHAMHHQRGSDPVMILASEVPADWQQRLTAPRAPIMDLSFDRPRVMGILNVTPDSFSDGGSHNTATRAVSHAQRMVDHGVDIIDIGGESTRPGAQTVPIEAEIARIEPVIQALRHSITCPISIDTRKSAVAQVAVGSGANLVNDISGFTFDPLLARYCADNDLPVCIMHARGDPATMHIDPHYDNVLLDVYDFLEAQVAKLEEQGIPREKVIVDPGIGFGKDIGHNLTLLHNVSLFHGLGCAVLVGASRKGFIGRISKTETASERMPGSLAVALAVIAQGVQIVRVHDVVETTQALSLWHAISKGEHS
jgi:dihydropteroate synthase